MKNHSFLFMTALSGLIVITTNCAQIVGIEEGLPRIETNCASVADCEVLASECHLAQACTDGKCIFENVVRGTSLSQQMQGDCTKEVCDGDGATELVVAVDDIHDDENACTADSCDNAMPVHTPIAEYVCYSGPAGTMDVGVCKAGIQKCDASGNATGACEGEVIPQPELCDLGKLDENCDGSANETGTEGGSCTCGDGVISTGIGEECDDAGVIGGSCTPICTSTWAVGISVGAYHGCAWLNTGAVKCWGANAAGQLGLGNNTIVGDGPGELGSNLMVSNLGTNKSVTSLAFGINFGCAHFMDGTTRCWGRNDRGQLCEGNALTRGDGPNEMGDNIPNLDVGPGVTVVSMAGGRVHFCALLSDGNVKCWGGAGAGQTGLGTTLDRGKLPNENGANLPAVNLGTGKKAKWLAAGQFHTCVILDDDKLKCWGENADGQLGLGDVLPRGKVAADMGDNLPAVNLGTGAIPKAVTAGEAHTCVLLIDGRVKCWGGNTVGQLGLGDKVPRGASVMDMGDNLPMVDLGTNAIATAIHTFGNHTCALLSDGTLKCWGPNNSGQLGQGDTVHRGDDPLEMGDSLKPVNLGTGRKVLAFDVGEAFTCVLLDDQSIKCFGFNDSGRLGVGDTLTRGDGPNEMGDNLPTVKLFSDLW